MTSRPRLSVSFIRSATTRMVKPLHPFICLIAVMALSGCGGSSEPTDGAALAKCYAQEFGAYPPAGVSHLQAKQVVVGDAGGAWLRFVADPVTFDNSVIKRFTPCDHSTFAHYDGSGGNTPSWWKPAPTPTTKYYRCSNWRTGTNNYSESVIAYDRANNVVHFHHGISF
jgi:hypothetical protein